VLREEDAHELVFVPVRDPLTAAIARDVDPRMRLMVSPESVSFESTEEQVLAALDEHAALHPELVELKYLHHLRAPRLRQWARAHGARVLYDEIKETDPSQFTGQYENNLGRLIDDILEDGEDVMIQTNTVGELRDALSARPR
jgi:hypothetical protein